MELNHALEAASKLNTANIGPGRYLPALVSEAVRLGLLTDGQVEDIQAQLAQALTMCVQRYTSKGSTSVRVEVAQRLLESVTYSVDAYLLSLGSHQRSLNALLSDRVPALRDRGLKLLRDDVEQAKRLLRAAQESRVAAAPTACHNTLDEALPEFLRDYDAEFDVLGGAGGIDYPLALDDESLTGIRYIRRYLERMLMENAFCAAFVPEDIGRLLTGYGALYGTDYRELLVNVCEVVLCNSVCAVLLGKFAGTLAVSAAECDALQKKLRRLPKRAVALAVGKGVGELCGQMKLAAPLPAYLAACGEPLSVRLHHAVSQGALARAVVVDAGF